MVRVVTQEIAPVHSVTSVSSCQTINPLLTRITTPTVTDHAITKQRKVQIPVPPPIVSQVATPAVSRTVITSKLAVAAPSVRAIVTHVPVVANRATPISITKVAILAQAVPKIATLGLIVLHLISPAYVA